MDYLELKKLYGRLQGLSRTVQIEKSISGLLGDQFNSIVDKISEIIEEDCNYLKIPKDSFFTDHLGKRPWVDTVDFRGQLNQMIHFLEYGYNLNESIIEIASIYNSIEDEELKGRCSNLLSAPTNFDIAVNQATLILEERIRNKVNPPLSDTGVGLISKLITQNPTTSKIKFSDEGYIQEGISQILRGIFLAIRNPSHHTISENFSREEALKTVAFIDILLAKLNIATVQP